MPIRGFLGEHHQHRDGLATQFATAQKLALVRGFTNVSFQIVPGQDHNPMPSVVLAYVDSLQRAR